jgi:hypothetical protein
VRKRVLIGCERSGVIRRAFRALGHDAWSCDLEPADDGSEYHYQGDVLARLRDGWDLAIFHPDCTRMANSGVRWLRERNLWDGVHSGAAFMRVLWDAPIEQVAIENPIQHKYAKAVHGMGKPTQTVQPSDFGDPFRKATCLWLRNLPKLVPTKIIPRAECREAVWLESPGEDRARRRSQTYPGMADAFAHQWGGIVIPRLEVAA